MVTRTISKTTVAIALAISANFAHSKTIGEGEYRFGPETAENVACKIAEERAKQDAIENFVGELIEHSTNEICKDERCSTLRSFHSETSGEIKKIHRLETLVHPEQKHSVCVVHIVADVEKVTNSIQLTIQSQKEFKHGDRFKISGATNRVGSLGIFNVVDDKHTLVWQGKVFAPNKEFSLPTNDQKIEARLPSGKSQSKELLVYVFTEENLTFRPFYSRIEFTQMVKDLPFLGRKVVINQIQILR
jgi:hypothetical protein